MDRYNGTAIRRIDYIKPWQVPCYRVVEIQFTLFPQLKYGNDCGDFGHGPPVIYGLRHGLYAARTISVAKSTVVNKSAIFDYGSRQPGWIARCSKLYKESI